MLRELKYYFCCSSAQLVYSDKRSNEKSKQACLAAMLKNRKRTSSVNTRREEVFCASHRAIDYDRLSIMIDTIDTCDFDCYSSQLLQGAIQDSVLSSRATWREREREKGSHIVFLINLMYVWHGAYALIALAKHRHLSLLCRDDRRIKAVRQRGERETNRVTE